MTGSRVNADSSGDHVLQPFRADYRPRQVSVDFLCIQVQSLGERPRCRQALGDSPFAGRDWPRAAAYVDHDVAGHEVGQGEHVGSFCVVKQGKVRIDLIRLGGRRAS
jgi:hypothetical protein